MRHVLVLMATAMFLAHFVSGQWDHAAAAEFYVAADGDDTNPGTEAQPFATVGKARDAVRSLIAASISCGEVPTSLPISTSLAPTCRTAKS